MRRRKDHSLETPVASLIDVVFLLIIFFVVTAAVEKDVVDESIKLAQADYVPAVEKKDPRTITINLQNNGAVNIALQPLSLTRLQQILTATRAKSGNTVPIVIRADEDTLFKEVDRVMRAIGETGLYRVKLSAVATGRKQAGASQYTRSSKTMAKRIRKVVEAAQIPMSSMIDVVFLLLIYFIVTQKDEISEAHLAVNLPSPNQNQQTETKPKFLELEVHPGGQVFLQGVPKPLAQVRETLAYLASLDSEQTVIVKTSVMATTEDLVTVLDMCKGVGLEKLNVMTLQ